MGDFKHVSVLLNEAVCGLYVLPGGIYVDGTTGGGGHSLEIAKLLKKGKLICIDRDEEALDFAKNRLKDYQNIEFLKSNYKDIESILNKKNIKANGVLLDLGVSSYQIDEKKRGFSYMDEGATLDMRMDRSQDFCAADIINTYDKDELVRIFKEYGEEKFANKIANAIVRERSLKPFKTTGDLVEVIRKNTPKNLSKGHPAKRVFQAVRIEVNEELTGLYDFIYNLPKVMADKGRISIITFHSLEDRIVKQAFKKMADPCTCPKEFPMCVCGKVSLGKIINKKPILPSDEEIANNTRSKSAKLRIFEVSK